jgi:EAL domain-containing protein (putative c-di-GMP-specific phosphodiesterase class I)
LGEDIARDLREVGGKTGEQQAARLCLERDLASALEQGQLRVAYQPKVDRTSRRIVGAEALLRWQLAEWRLHSIDLVPVAVNISGRQLAQGDPLALVRHCLGQSGIQAGQIELELTESTLMNDTSLAARVLRDLRNMRIKVSLDDFGAGYSSLGYLKRFPLSTLKIDRSFVRDIETDDDDATIVKVIIALAGSLGIQVIAEGVENEHQVDFLRTHGCQQVQGFLFSRPLTAVDFAHLLRRGQATPVWPRARPPRSRLPAA